MRTLKQRLQAGEQMVVCSIGRLLNHNFIHLVGMAGQFQGIWLDLEHVGFTTEQIEVATLAARHHDLDVFCRVAPTDYATVTRCFEAGAGGVMAAQIETAAQAEQFIQWAKFAPRGRRGLNTGGWDGRFTMTPAAEMCRRANEETLVLIQIETLSALEQCREIAAIDGVDGLFVGPADLSQSLGVTGEFFHEKCIAAIDKVSAACREANKPWAAVAFTPDHARLMIDRGCKMLSPTNDLRIVLAGLGEINKQFQEFFPK